MFEKKCSIRGYYLTILLIFMALSARIFNRSAYATRSDTERNLIGRRTESDQTPNAILSDGERCTMTCI